jgi:hypothetical protein
MKGFGRSCAVFSRALDYSPAERIAFFSNSTNTAGDGAASKR